MNSITRSLPRFLLPSLCGLLFAVPTFVDGANIVVNGSFEDNADLITPPWPTAPLTSWTVGEVLGVPPTINQNKVDGLDTTVLYALAPQSGNIAAAFNSTSNTITTGGLATLSQALVTVATQAYDLVFWIANPIQQANNLNNIFSVSWDGALQTLSSPWLTETSVGSKNYIVTGNTAWFQVTVSNLIATGASTNLEFSGRNSDWGTLLDNVSVDASGVPDNGGSFALLGIALAGLALFHRKEQRAALA